MPPLPARPLAVTLISCFPLVPLVRSSPIHPPRPDPTFCFLLPLPTFTHSLQPSPMYLSLARTLPALVRHPTACR